MSDQAKVWDNVVMWARLQSNTQLKVPITVAELLALHRAYEELDDVVEKHQDVIIDMQKDLDKAEQRIRELEASNTLLETALKQIRDNPDKRIKELEAKIRDLEQKNSTLADEVLRLGGKVSGGG